jgi:hypothetical protein
LRKEAERLPDTLGELRSEQDVREVVRHLNQRILQWRRIPEGPPIYLRLVNEEDMVARWRQTRTRPAAPVPPGPRPAPPPAARGGWGRLILLTGPPGRCLPGRPCSGEPGCPACCST